MEEIYEKIMREGYGLQLRHGTRTRTGLVCRTDRGLRELKKPRGSTDSLRLAFDVKKRLRENGFANISRCYPTLEGEPFYRQDGTLYILEDVLPQGTLAEAVGVSRQTVNAIEKGEYNPTINLCRQICRVLGKTLDELFWEDDQGDPED